MQLLIYAYNQKYNITNIALNFGAILGRKKTKKFNLKC